MKTLLLFGLFCLQTATPNGCLPAKLRKSLDKKRDPVNRYLLLAKVGEEQAAKLAQPPPGTIDLPERTPMPKRRALGEIQNLHDCAWSELLENLWQWKPQSPRDRQAVQEMLRRAQHAERLLKKLLNELELAREPQTGESMELPQPGSRKPRSMELVRDVKERLQALSK